MHFILLVIICLFAQGCSTPYSTSYKMMYDHLKAPQQQITSLVDKDYYLIIFVDARHLDYTNNKSFLNTIAKHPSDGSKNRDVGHSWIHLHATCPSPIDIEGGHSGEFGIIQPKYFDGIMNYIDYGCVSHAEITTSPYRYEPNPIRYLWETQHDGIFQKGSGNHNATYGVQIFLTQEQFEKIYNFIHSYNYTNYSITENQCSSFVAHVAMLADLDLECEVTMKIQPEIYYRGRKVHLWSDPSFSLLTISSPDILEKSLMQAVSKQKCRRIK